MWKVLAENVVVALRSIRSQLMRTVLTMLIIALGIMSLVGMLTAIDVLEQSIGASFSFMGANTFTLSGNAGKMKVSRQKSRALPYRALSLEEVTAFRERYTFPSVVSLSVELTATALVKFQNRKTTPNVNVTAVDENFLTTGGYTVQEGRNFTNREVQAGAPVCLAGNEVNKQLATGGRSLVDQEILFRGQHLRVVGILAKSGSGFNASRDRTLLLPLGLFRQQFAGPDADYFLNVKVARAEMMGPATDEARGLMRSIRRLRPGDSENFEIQRSDNFLRTLRELTGVLSAGAFVIAFITLLGAMTGLINIMLVAVNERTREIGVRKAMGATRGHIVLQFLTEAVVMCLLGGLAGILAGTGIGNSIALFTGGQFVAPWRWMLFSLVVCTLTGILAGIGPALRAARLHPVEALRYE